MEDLKYCPTCNIRLILWINFETAKEYLLCGKCGYEEEEDE